MNYSAPNFEPKKKKDQLKKNDEIERYDIL